MAQPAIIIPVLTTETTITVTNGNAQIHTAYVSELPYVLSAELAAMNLKNVNEGELIIKTKVGSDKFYVELNDRGELIVTSQDASRYSINSLTGQLVYTT